MDEVLKRLNHIHGLMMDRADTARGMALDRDPISSIRLLAMAEAYDGAADLVLDLVNDLGADHG